MKKKLTNLSVAVVLLVACVISFAVEGNGALAGAGLGKNYRVSNVQEFIEVLDFVKSSKEIKLALVSDVDDGGKESEEDNAASTTHKSATVYIKTMLKSEVKSTNPDLASNSTQSLERELICYFTENGSFYSSCGVMKSKVGEKVTTFDFDMDIFYSGTNAYAKIRKFNLIEPDCSTVIKSEMINKWIDMPVSFAEEILDVDSLNRETFSAFHEFFDFLYENGEIKDSDTNVSLNATEFASIVEKYDDSYFDPDKYKINFELDLSNPTAPFIQVNSNYSDSRTYSTEQGYKHSGTVSQSVRNDLTIVIKNIDNTVIRWKDSYVAYIFDDEDDPDEMFNMKEFEVDENE